MDWYIRDISWMSWRGSVVPSGSPQSSWDRDLEPTNMSKAVFKDHLPEQLWQMVHIEKSSTTFGKIFGQHDLVFYLKNHLYQHFHNKKNHEKMFPKVGPEAIPTIQNVSTFQPSINKGEPWDPWLGGGPLVGSTSGCRDPWPLRTAPKPIACNQTRAWSKLPTCCCNKGRCAHGFMEGGGKHVEDMY